MKVTTEGIRYIFLLKLFKEQIPLHLTQRLDQPRFHIFLKKVYTILYYSDSFETITTIF